MCGRDFDKRTTFVMLNQHIDSCVGVQEEQPVSAVPPPFLSMERTSLAAGIGISWGSGTLTFDGREYDFSAKGLSLGNLGASKDVTVGEISNLTDLADFEGRYLAIEAGATAGVGVAALTMRNEKGVVISLRSSLQGGRLTLGPEGLRIALEQ